MISKWDRTGETAVMVIKAGEKTLYANLEDSNPAKTFVDLLSRGEIACTLKEGEKGELFCTVPWISSVSPLQNDFREGDIVLYKDKLAFICSPVKLYAAKAGHIGTEVPDGLKELLRENRTIRLSVEWSE